MFSHKSIGLIVLIAALIASAIATSGAAATIVQPESEAITVTNDGNAVFIPENAYAEESVQCEESGGVLTTPGNAAPPAGISADTNRAEVGTHSTGSGSVSVPFSTGPTFTKCNLYVWNGEAWVKTKVPVEVETSGVWTVAATQNTAGVTSGGSLAIAIPPEGAIIDIGSGACVLKVPPPGWAESVNSTYTNANAKAVVDGQVHFTESPSQCAGGTELAQFEGTYTAGNGFTIEN